MPTTAKTAAQTWIRAELVGVPDSSFGPRLMIPADGVEFHGPDLVFHQDGDVVYVTRPDQLRSLTWLGPGTDPDRERRRAQWPNHGKRWTDEQRTRLREEILAGAAWDEIARGHGRSRTGVQQEAVKQGWVEAETLRPAAGLLDRQDADRVRADHDGTEPGDGIAEPGETDETDVVPGRADDDASGPSGSHRVRVRSRRRTGDTAPDASDGFTGPELTDPPSQTGFPEQRRISTVPTAILGSYQIGVAASPAHVDGTPLGTAPPEPVRLVDLVGDGLREPGTRPPFLGDAREPRGEAAGEAPTPRSQSSEHPDPPPPHAADRSTLIQDPYRHPSPDARPEPRPGPRPDARPGTTTETRPTFPPRTPSDRPPAIPRPRDPERRPAELSPARSPGS